ncbi:MAG: DUF4212 domain-containing protein [Desulfuromonadales bacterium]|nr:DUF4212 domain-containing protein [Desulfuromonadales bacterium]
MEDRSSGAYWTQVLKLLRNVLIVWFVVSYGFGIILVDLFNKVSLGGYPLGFWFAQQGSLYIFVILIFYYGNKMGKLDIKFDVEEK